MTEPGTYVEIEVSGGYISYFLMIMDFRLKTAVLFAILSLVIYAPEITYAASASKCDDHNEDLAVLDLKLLQNSYRLSNIEKVLENSQKHLDDMSNAMARVLSGSQYSMTDSVILTHYCKDAILPNGKLDEVYATSCLNEALKKMMDGKREAAKMVEEARAEDRDLRNQIFHIRELVAAAGCASEDAAPGVATEDIPPRDTSTLCAEKWAGLRALRVRLEGIRAEYDKAAQTLAAAEKELDHMTAQAAAVQIENWHEMSLPSAILACAGYFSKNVTPEKVVGCYNEFVAGALKDVKAQRKILEDVREKDKEARREAATIRDIAAEMKCPEPPPLNVSPLPELAPLKEPKPVSAPVAPEPTGQTVSPTPSQPAGISQGDVSAFIGRWTGTVTVTASSEKGMVGLKETATMEIVPVGKSIGIKTHMGIFGDPAAYNVKVTGKRLQVRYTGPSNTTAATGIPATLDYTLDVTLNGNQLSGESRTQSTASHAGQTAVMWFTQKMSMSR